MIRPAVRGVPAAADAAVMILRRGILRRRRRRWLGLLQEDTMKTTAITFATLALALAGLSACQRSRDSTGYNDNVASNQATSTSPGTATGSSADGGSSIAGTSASGTTSVDNGGATDVAMGGSADSMNDMNSDDGAAGANTGTAADTANGASANGGSGAVAMNDGSVSSDATVVGAPSADSGSGSSLGTADSSSGSSQGAADSSGSEADGAARAAEVSDSSSSGVGDLVAWHQRQLALAQLAEKSASRPELKQWAQQQSAAEQKALQQLGSSDSGASSSSSSSSSSMADDGSLSTLRSAKGDDFDRQFIDAWLDAPAPTVSPSSSLPQSRLDALNKMQQQQTTQLQSWRDSWFDDSNGAGNGSPPTSSDSAGSTNSNDTGSRPLQQR
jgi:uncharacterized protein (DUF305 family)